MHSNAVDTPKINIFFKFYDYSMIYRQKSGFARTHYISCDFLHLYNLFCVIILSVIDIYTQYSNTEQGAFYIYIYFFFKEMGIYQYCILIVWPDIF